MSRFRVFIPIAVALFLSSLAFAQADIAPGEVVRRMVHNELTSSDHAHWMYLSKKLNKGKTYLRQVIQTRDVGLERLLAVDGVPLSAAERAKEDRRLARLVGDQDALRKRRREQEEDKQKAQEMMKLLPDAFLYQYAGHEGELIKLTFKPNPDFDPPTREARVFHAMEGEMWVQQDEMRLARLRGRLMEDVNFGWGILGHLDKGGRFEVQQTEVAPRIWEMTYLHVDMRGRALLFATINTQEHETMTQFERVPDELTVAKAAELLMRTEHLARGY